MRRPRLSKKVWIKPERELWKFFKVTTFVFEQDGLLADIKTFYKRIIWLNKRSGSNFTFLYLKECMRLIIKRLSGSPEVYFISGIYISRDRYGLPKILPFNFRKLILKGDSTVIKYFLSLINVYRVWPSVQRIKLGSITGPFAGVSKEIPRLLLYRAVDELVDKKLNLRDMKLLKLETAGPVAWKSSWSSAGDIICLLYHPKKFLTLLRFMRWSIVNVLLATWVLLLLIVSVPCLLLFYTLSLIPFILVVKRLPQGDWPIINHDVIPLSIIHNSLSQFGLVVYRLPWIKREDVPLGRLSVVYDQAGKGRVVAITNYFLQVWLYPLHLAIFEILKGIKEDGTFDQRKPLDVLIQGESDELFHSFDLSSATDRIPVDIQIQVLNHLEDGLGWNWYRLLDLNWLSPNKKQFVKYAVGQPMGAYSSWAMLALTHHVIVRCSSLMCGIESFSDYAILGDDIVIRNNQVAQQYLKLMSDLGVSINPSKSVISKDFAEFAKVWVGPTVNYTPVGSGITLRFIRDYNYLGAYMAELSKTQVVETYSAFLKILQEIKVPLESLRIAGLWSIFGQKGTMWRLDESDASYLEKSIGDILSSSHLPTVFHNLTSRIHWFEYENTEIEEMWVPFDITVDFIILWNSFRMLKDKLITENLCKIPSGYVTILKNCMRTTCRHWSLAVFEQLTRFITPGFYVYFIFLLKEYITLIDNWFKIWYLTDIKPTRESMCMLDDILPAVADIDFTDRVQVKRLLTTFKQLRSIFTLIKSYKIYKPINMSLSAFIHSLTFDGNNIRKGLELPKSFCAHTKYSLPKVLGLPIPLASGLTIRKHGNSNIKSFVARTLQGSVPKSKKRSSRRTLKAKKHSSHKQRTIL